MTTLMGLVVGFGIGVGTSWFEYRWLTRFQQGIHGTMVEQGRWPWLRSFVVSTAMALVVAALFYQYGLSVQACGYAALACIVAAATLTDLDASVIPNRLVVAGIIFWVATTGFVSSPHSGFGIGSLLVPFFGQGVLAACVDGLLGAFVVAGCVMLVAVVTEQVTGKKALGGGDIKLLFVTGLYLGLVGSACNLFLSCILGLFVSPIWKHSKKQHRQLPTQQQPTHTFPFAPAIALATITTLLTGQSTIAYLLGLA